MTMPLTYGLGIRFSQCLGSNLGVYRVQPQVMEHMQVPVLVNICPVPPKEIPTCISLYIITYDCTLV